MHDIKAIRENPEFYDLAWKNRNFTAQSTKLIELDEARRSAIVQKQEAETERNRISRKTGEAKTSGDLVRFERYRKEVARLKEEIATATILEEKYNQELNKTLSTLPNMLDDEVPIGRDETDNIEIRRWGNPRSFDFAPKAHYDLGEALGLLDFETASKISGSRFSILKGSLARLERAIAHFMLDIHTESFGYLEVSPPYLVRSPSLYGTGQLPKFAEDLFKTTDDFWLIPTAEVALTNLVRESMISEEVLPLRFVAHTPCFRSEAGSAGKDTRGLIRMHQFPKVELVSITRPEHSKEELERMTNCAETLLKKLDLSYRVIALCSGDIGFSARKTYDIEVWLPESRSYREISSCSNCGDFQAHRMKARYRKKGEKHSGYVHTLNGSGLAVGRTLVALLENYQQEDGSITIPEPLRPYMNGLESIIKYG